MVVGTPTLAGFMLLLAVVNSSGHDAAV